MKVAKCLFMGLFLLLHTNCSYELENVEAPDNLIPIDTFTLVLQDVMIVESYYKSQEANVNTFYETLPTAMHPIFEKYNIEDRKSTRLNSSHVRISYAVFCLKKK